MENRVTKTPEHSQQSHIMEDILRGYTSRPQGRIIDNTREYHLS